MQYVILEKKNFDSFISLLAREEKVFAPVARGFKNFVFQEVTSGQDIALKYIPTIIPPKKYFNPKKESLIDYAISEGSWSAVAEQEKMVIFGVHTCDLAGIQCLNMAFSEKPRDQNYLIRKNKIAIIGLECADYCDEFASCRLMHNHLPNGGYDLFFTELNGFFMVHINTALGEEFIKLTNLCQPAREDHFKKLEELREKKRTIFKNEASASHHDLKNIFDRTVTSAVWDDLNKRCVACGNCTTVCPTCYCFDVADEINLDFNSGTRVRRWDSCQNEEFAKVAGGESFRKLRGHRQRHRYMRKFSYPVGKFSRYFCTGCGRCSRFCVAEINLKETINALQKEIK